MARFIYTSLALCALIVVCLGSASPPVRVQTLSKDTSNEYCWCLDSHTTAGSTFCMATCDAKFTCNSHGKCQGNVCKCDPKFAGSFCERCEGNRASSNNVTLLCDVCMPGWYGENCDVPCSAQNCPGGTCDKNSGVCTCPLGKKGVNCAVCDLEKGYFPDGSNGCAYCDDKKNCTGYGFCISRNSPSDPYCLCPPPFTGVKCDACINPNNTIATACGVPRLKGGAAASRCKPPNLLLPVLIAIIASVVIIAIVLGAYLWYVKKKAAQAASNAFSNDFDDAQDDGVAYNKM